MMLRGRKRLTVGSTIALAGACSQLILGIGILTKGVPQCNNSGCVEGYILEIALVAVPSTLALNAIRRQRMGPLCLYSLLGAFSSLMLTYMNWLWGYLFCPAGLALLIAGPTVIIETNVLWTDASRLKESQPRAENSPSSINEINGRNVQSTKRVPTRSLYSGLMLWVVSLIALYASWFVIFSISKNAGGTWPSILILWLDLMYIVSIAWSIAAALMFRKDALRLIEVNRQLTDQNNNYRLKTSIIPLCMICCPFIMIVIFLFATNR